MISSWPTVLTSHPSATQSKMQSASRTPNGWSSLGSALTWAASRSLMQETLVAGSARATARTTTFLVGSARARHPSTWKCRHTASWKRTSFSSAEIAVSVVRVIVWPCRFCLINNFTFSLAWVRAYLCGLFLSAVLLLAPDTNE
uniref:Uncharacterized protein n=1 Tax=Zea mays TaxID=4577 RepID=C4JAD7_MAIZE|nr:unknown [Zea mays]